tara:strand:- start:254 stop:448 length:195 start_codon:yes stop_codon:yes gene_type:complete
MSNIVNDQIKEQLYDDCSKMTVEELCNWLKENNKATFFRHRLTVDTLLNIMNIYCEIEFDKRAE